MNHVLLVPRWGGTAASDWVPWLREQLDVPVTVGELLPVADAPTIDAMIASLTELTAGRDLSQTLLVGHSVGCQAWLRWLASDHGRPVGGLVAVAGWFTLDSTWPPIVPWVDTPIDTERVRRRCPSVHLLLSDDDPFTGDHVANAATWEQRLGARVQLVPGARHFNGGQEPTVLAAVREAVA